MHTSERDGDGVAARVRGVVRYLKSGNIGCDVFDRGWAKVELRALCSDVVAHVEVR